MSASADIDLETAQPTDLPAQEIEQENRRSSQYDEDVEELDSVGYESNTCHDYNKKDKERGMTAPIASSDNDADDQPTISRSRPGSQTEAGNSATSTLARTLILIRTRESGHNLGPPPDGGFGAWSQVLLAHIVMINTWGYTNAFGIFQEYYTQHLNQTPSDISWIGSVQTFLVFFIGTFGGRATDAGYFKFTWSCGMFIATISLFLTSLCTEYWQIFLSQGIMQGFGAGLMFCPTVALVTTYFDKRRALAVSATAAGSSTGGLLIPAIVNSLLDKIGFAWTLRVLGFFTFATLLPSLFFLRQRLPPRTTGPLVEFSAFREVPYSCYVSGMFFILWGLYVGFFYVSSFASDILDASSSTSSALLMVMSGVGIPGRVLPGLICDAFTGPLNLIIPFSFGSAVVSFGWVGVHNISSLYVWAVIYGIMSAGVQGLFPVGVSSLNDDLKKAGVRIGMAMTIVSFAALTGSPIAGALVQVDNGDYLYMQMFMGSVMTLGVTLLIVARVHRFGFAWVKG